jgi:hypothetical protein
MWRSGTQRLEGGGGGQSFQECACWRARKDWSQTTFGPKSLSRVVKFLYNSPLMPKHPRKRQKTTNDSYDVQRALVDDSSKDDEERRLESLLFGTKFVPSAQVLQDVGSKELQNLTDTDVINSYITPDFFSDLSSYFMWTTGSHPRFPTLPSTSVGMGTRDHQRGHSMKMMKTAVKARQILNQSQIRTKNRIL